MSYSIFRVEKVKNAVDTKGLQKHNQRENQNYGNKDIDFEKVHLNYDLINEKPIEYKEKIEEIIDEGYNGKRKIRSDAVKLVDGIITSDKDFFDNLPPGSQEKYFEDCLDFLKDEYGEKNLVYATVHLDEKTPHMHFGFVPLTEDGRLSAKEVLGNKKAMSELQDRFNDFVNQKGYQLDRGEKGSTNEHLDIQKFKEKTLNEKVTELENEYQNLNQNLEKIRKLDLEIREIDNIETKAKKSLFKDSYTLEKEDFERFKNVAKLGVVTVEKYNELKETNVQSVRELTVSYKQMERERNRFMDRNLELVKENKKLKENLLDSQRQFKLLKNTLDKIREGMKVLCKKIESPMLLELFNKLAKDTYSNELEKYKTERSKTQEKGQEVER